MSRQPLNNSFLQTSFLHGSNISYIEEMHALYERNPGSVADEWRHFFSSLQEEQGRASVEAAGASWAVPLNKLRDASGDEDIVAALSGDYAQLETHMHTQIRARASQGGLDISMASSLRATQDSIRALMLIRAYRMRGHRVAKLDPLNLIKTGDHPELDPQTYGFTEADYDRPIFIDYVLGLETATVRQILDILERTYCRNIGVEFLHISTVQEKSWIQERIEGEGKDVSFTNEGKKAILNKLMEAESYEKFCEVKYKGTKRFGLEGGEAMVPALEQIIKRGGQLGIKEVVFGMAHRGRLNVLANVMGKPHRAIFNEFMGGSFKPADVEGSGDVKYHLGASSDREFDGNNVHLSLTANPSHLEIVDPVVLGKVRAKQDQHNDKDRTEVLPLLIHGDAAFAGQGVVAECFGLSGLKGHKTGGSIHFVINNQVGFTTNPRFSRSSPYCSDVARMIEAPIFHVNGDDPEAVVHVAKIAIEFRQTFKKPVVIDMFCYRRHGHNEGDEPMFTQPLMYRAIKNHPTTFTTYSKQLIGEGVVSSAEVDQIHSDFRSKLELEFAEAESFKPSKADWLDGKWAGFSPADGGARRGDTGVDINTLKEVGRRITTLPSDFNAHRTAVRLIDKRRQMIEEEKGIDWGMAEHLAFGTLLHEKLPIRLSGQDVERGTFSQRHAVLVDQDNEQRYKPLKYVSPDQARFEVINSMLSEEAVLGFEYGYTLAEPNTLTLWEAQFGDFANGAQVVIDQFISSGESKWLRMSGLVLLLPHGYEGQGPEHSSARIERYLQISAEDNWQIANCTTPANYFHILRRQLNRNFRKPLIIFTPKSLLRHKRVVSSLADLGTGTTFHRVLWDDADKKYIPSGRTEIDLKPDEKIRRVVICCGKVYYDLLETREKEGINDVYLLRLEQVYPFPSDALKNELCRFGHAAIVWCQEEPRNMGCWTFVEPYIEEVLTQINATHGRPVYAGRTSASSTATGQLSQHLEEQKALVDKALKG
ncbi:MAG: 2-oxoglutarate dehydrogenase E1 component [Hyphomicrobiaceae bacterium hypho_1]